MRGLGSERVGGRTRTSAHATCRSQVVGSQGPISISREGVTSAQPLRRPKARAHPGEATSRSPVDPEGLRRLTRVPRKSEALLQRRALSCPVPTQPSPVPREHGPASVTGVPPRGPHTCAQAWGCPGVLPETGRPDTPSSRPQPPTGPGSETPERRALGVCPQPGPKLKAQQNSQSWQVGPLFGFGFSTSQRMSHPWSGSATCLLRPEPRPGGSSRLGLGCCRLRAGFRASAQSPGPCLGVSPYWLLREGHKVTSALSIPREQAQF